MIGSEPELSKGNVPVTAGFKLLTSSVGDTTEEMIKLIIVSRDKCHKDWYWQFVMNGYLTFC